MNLPQRATGITFVLATVLSLAISGILVVAIEEQVQTASAQQQPPPPQENKETTISGIITSTQLNDAGAPQWLAAGSWKLVTDMPIFGGNNQTKPTVKAFDAVIDMVLLSNGTMFHTHHISNFKQSEVLFKGNNVTAFNGTMTVTTEKGPTEEVPGFLQFHNNMMSVWVNPGKIQNHFGPTPINGMILSPEKLQEIRSLEAQELQQGNQGNTTR
jgi:hypothetical protein